MFAVSKIGCIPAQKQFFFLQGENGDISKGLPKIEKTEKEITVPMFRTNGNKQ